MTKKKPARKNPTRKRTLKPRPPRAPRARRAAAKPGADALTGPVPVTMTIVLGGGAPGDVMSVRRIDNVPLSGAGTLVARGAHTAGWDVLSPTVRPLPFAVTVTDVATGRVLLSRPNEVTGRDGRGAGADRFTV